MEQDDAKKKFHIIDIYIASDALSSYNIIYKIRDFFSKYSKQSNMAEAQKNRLAAKIIKAEMINDHVTVSKLRFELANLATIKPCQRPAISSERFSNKSGSSRFSPYPDKNLDDGRIKKFLNNTSSLSQMFVQEKKLTASDEVKMYLTTSAKFSRDDMETKHFSQEVDNSQHILEKTDKHRRQKGPQLEAKDYDKAQHYPYPNKEICDICLERQAKHLVVDKQEFVYLTLDDCEPFLSSMSNAIIRNKDHSSASFISAGNDIQSEVEKIVSNIRSVWKQESYRCIIMETYMKNKKPARKEFASCGNHFQIQCLPVKEKNLEKARMYFKQALQSSESEWSLNKKIVSTNSRKIHRCLPKGLSYFWVCFDDLDNGFGHVIENENEFSRYFGLEVLSGMLDKDFNSKRMNRTEEFREQFERCRKFKVMYAKNVNK